MENIELAYALTNQYLFQEAKNNIQDLGYYFSVHPSCSGNRLIEVGEEKFYKDLPKYASSLSERSILRAVHFFDENNRVDCVCNALNVGDFDCFIECLNKSGESSMQYLQNCYVAGGSQLIPKALAIAKRYNRGGACRVHGGGFAGCILCVVKNELVNEFIAKMGEFYDRENIIPLSIRSVGTITL